MELAARTDVCGFALGREKRQFAFDIGEPNTVCFECLAERRLVGFDLPWALVGTIVLVSVVLHGVTATPVMRRAR